MRGVHIERFGEPADVVSVMEAPPPEPGPGQVRVRMLAAPINPSDLMSIRGVYTKIPTLPFRPGYEGVGIVESSGGGLLGRMLVGRRVALLSADGATWCEYAIVSARQAVPISSDLPLQDAAMFFVNPLTAYLLTRDVLQVPSGQWLLQTAAGSALGRMIIKLSKEFGFRTINVVRRQAQVAELKSLGADEVIATDDASIADEVRRITGGTGVLHAIDCVGGTTGSAIVRALAPGGRLIVFGTLSGEPLSFSSRDLMTPGARIEGFWLGNVMAGFGLVKKLSVVRKVSQLIRRGILNAEVGQWVDLDQIKVGVSAAERPARGGKVLLRHPSTNHADI